MPVARGITASLFVLHFASTPDVPAASFSALHLLSCHILVSQHRFFCSIVLCIAFASMLYPGTAASFFIGISRCQL